MSRRVGGGGGDISHVQSLYALSLGALGNIGCKADIHNCRCSRSTTPSQIVKDYKLRISMCWFSVATH